MNAASPEAGHGPRIARLSMAGSGRLAQSIEASRTALVLATHGGTITMANSQAERMFGYDRGELLGMTLEVLMPERFRKGHVALRELYQANTIRQIMGSGRELFGLRRCGSEFPIEVSLSPVAVGHEVMVLAGITDITARRDGEREQEAQRAALEQSNADLEEFAYVASHDLKAPLRAIDHLVQWISEDIGGTASQETRENLALLAGRVLRMHNLLDGLLAYARAGRIHIDTEVLDIGDMVSDIVALLAPKPGFEIVFTGPCTSLRTNKIPLQVVLENLISNGLKHHDRDSGRIEVGMRLDDGVAEFTVTDDGPGIPARFHERIFVIFNTLKTRDDVESSGVGLSIVKRKIQVHGGSIRVESAPPARGTRFIFTWAAAT